MTVKVPANPPGPPGVVPVSVTNSPTQNPCGVPSVVIVAVVPFPVAETMLITAALPLTTGAAARLGGATSNESVVLAGKVVVPRMGTRKHHAASVRIKYLNLFRVPDRGSGNPTPLGGWDRGYCASGTGVNTWRPGYWVASSGNMTDEVWVEYIKNQTPPEPDDNFNVT